MEDACTVGPVTDERVSNGLTEVLLSWVNDNMSGADELFSGAGDPIDSKSSRTSVPLFWAWVVPDTKVKQTYANWFQILCMQITFFV